MTKTNNDSDNKPQQKHCLGLVSSPILAYVNTGVNVLFLTSDNEFSGIMYCLFRGRQNIFPTVFSTKFVKCATKLLKIG